LGKAFGSQPSAISPIRQPKADSRKLKADSKGDIMNTHEKETTRPRPGATQGNLYALRHGLFAKEDVIEGESHSEYMQLTARVMNEEHVVGAVEGQLATRMAGLIWRLGRVGRIEARVWEESPDTDEMVRRLERLALYESRLSRELERVRKELKAVQADRHNRNVEPVQYGPPPERIAAAVGTKDGKSGDARPAKIEKTIPPHPAKEIWETPFGVPTGAEPIACQRG
jgi:hypothetical protein